MNVTEATATVSTAAEAETPATKATTTTKITTTTTKATAEEKCPEGFWGLDCRYLCSDGCVGNTCERETGKCTDGCKQTNRDDAKANVDTHELGNLLFDCIL